jgi:hypothetical protein
MLVKIEFTSRSGQIESVTSLRFMPGYSTQHPHTDHDTQNFVSNAFPHCPLSDLEHCPYGKKLVNGERYRMNLIEKNAPVTVLRAERNRLWIEM